MSLALAWVVSRPPTGSIHTAFSLGGPFLGREPAGAQPKDVGPSQEQAWRPLGVKASEQSSGSSHCLQSPGSARPPGISLGDGAYLFGSSTNPEKRCPEIYF